MTQWFVVSLSCVFFPYNSLSFNLPGTETVSQIFSTVSQNTVEPLCRTTTKVLYIKVHLKPRLMTISVFK